jgi:hypothetical protein
MVVYKDSQSVTQLDPVEWTGTWRDAREVNTEGARPENELTGTIFTVNAQRVDALCVPHAFAAMRQWRHTVVASLAPTEKCVTTPFVSHLAYYSTKDVCKAHC